MYMYMYIYACMYTDINIYIYIYVYIYIYAVLWSALSGDRARAGPAKAVPKEPGTSPRSERPGRGPDSAGPPVKARDPAGLGLRHMAVSMNWGSFRRGLRLL